MRGGDDVLELEERRVGARLLGEHVEPGGGDLAGLQGVVQRLLVDDAATRGVDQHQAGTGPSELVGADQAHGLGGLGQVHADEVRLGHQLLEADHAHPHLGGATGLHVGVVGDHVHAEGGEAVGDEHADAAQPDDADGLLEQLGAAVPAALPLPAGERGVRRADVAGGGEHQRHRELGGAGDVGGRGVDHHDAVLRRGLHVDVVQPDAGAGDHLEPLGSEQRLGVDRGGRADQDGLGVGDGGEELDPVGAVAVPDLEVGSQGLHGGGTELLGDQYDGPGCGLGRGGERHEWSSQERVGAWPEGQGSSTTLCRPATLPAGDPSAAASRRPGLPRSSRTPEIGEGPSKYELLGPSGLTGNGDLPIDRSPAQVPVAVTCSPRRVAPPYGPSASSDPALPEGSA